MIQNSGSEESQLAIETSGRGATKESLINVYMRWQINSISMDGTSATTLTLDMY